MNKSSSLETFFDPYLFILLVCGMSVANSTPHHADYITIFKLENKTTQYDSVT